MMDVPTILIKTATMGRIVIETVSRLGMRIFGVAWLAGVMGIVSTYGAVATKCWRPPPAEHIARTDIIFHGEVISIRRTSRHPRERIATLKVLRNYKGADVPLIRIRYRDDWQSGVLRKGWHFEPGGIALIFAKGNSADRGDNGADARLSYCTMLPYHGRKRLQPVYWDKLSTMRPGLN